MNSGLLSWLFWDPPREAFTIPYFDIVVVWYGILFATGFIAGYYILIPILRKMFAFNPCIFSRDITNWSLLAAQIKNSSSEGFPPLFADLSKKAQNDLNSLQPNQEPSAELKRELVSSLNSVVGNKTLDINRKSLENCFPGAIVSSNTLASLFADRVTWFIVLGTIIGARLGHVFFYGWDYYSANPLEILMIRKGGLASHGGTVGVMLALLLFLRWNRKRFPEMSFIKLTDILVIPTALAVCFIRIANFFNQEILGNPTDKPWGVIFGHAADGSTPIPRHPVQLYEAIAYLVTFLVLYVLWKSKGFYLKIGTLTGLFFIMVFGSRFFLEFLKEPQSIMDGDGLQMGQYLSIPFVLFGLALLVIPRKNCSQKCSCPS